PIYDQFVRKHINNEQYFQIYENMSSGKLSRIQIYWLARLDPRFQQCLNSDQCIKPTTLKFLAWEDKRREYLRIKDKISTDAFGFVTASPHILNAVTSLFLY